MPTSKKSTASKSTIKVNDLKPTKKVKGGAQADHFLTLDGIKGESADQNHK